MIRLMGILTGSAIAVAILIITLGVPRFSPTPAKALPNPEPVVETEAPPSAEPATYPEPQVTIPEREPAVETHAAEMHAAQPSAESDNTPPFVPDVPASLLEDAPREVQDNWYAFWSPFRSEIAADGFVTELQRTTGLDYRVVKLKPGVYEVAFAYSDEHDIQDKLTRISTATGLDLSGG